MSKNWKWNVGDCCYWG